MNHTNILKLGLEGEKVIVEMLRQLDVDVYHVYDDNKYDREKDILVDGKYKVEVKTQAPFVKENSFSFLPNQIRKCTEADVLYFVSVPHPTWPHFSDGWVYRAIPKEFKYRNWKDRWGKERILIPIEQEALIPVFKMTDEKSKELQQLLSTMY
jgi:hypothetical protein